MAKSKEAASAYGHHHPDRGRWAALVALSLLALLLLMPGTNDSRMRKAFSSWTGNSTGGSTPTTLPVAAPLVAAALAADPSAAATAAIAAAASTTMQKAAAGAAAAVGAAAAAPAARRSSSGGGASPQQCLKHCCWQQVPATMAAAGGAPGERTSAKITPDDFLSPLNLKRLADVALGDLPRPPGYTYAPQLTVDMLPCLQNGTVIWVDTPSLGTFVNHWLPKIPVQFVLVSGDSDASAPGIFEPLLQDPRLVHWLAMNCDAPAGGKLTCLPLGVSQWRFTGPGNDVFLQAMALAVSPARLAALPAEKRARRKHPKAARRNVLVAIAMANRNGARRQAMQLFCGFEGQAARPDLRALATCLEHGDGGVPLAGLGLQDRYDLMAEHRFVLSPPRMGPDCYRTWEALLLGSYPIVLSSHLNSMYEGLPVLIVDSYKKVTPQLLDEAYARFSGRTDYVWGRVYLEYFQRLIAKHRAVAQGKGDRRQRLQYTSQRTRL